MVSRRFQQNAAVNDKARRAVSEFRKIQPTLTAFARVLTGSSRVRVIAATGVPRTDGKDIFIQPPIELGGQLMHDRAVCDRRDWNTMQQECPACAVREEVMATTYHEISHIAFESFVPPDDSRLKEALGYVRQVSSPKQAERIIRRITESPEIPKSYMALASVINPYFKLLANSLEDVRINARMHRARPGTKPMMDAQIMRVFSDGITKHDGTVVRWTEMHLNHQASIGSYLVASGFEPQLGWLADEVLVALKDEQLRNLLILLPEAADAHESFQASWQVFTRLRELGFYQLKEEEHDDEPEPEEEEPPAAPPVPTPPMPPQQPEPDDDDGDDSDSDDASDGDSAPGGDTESEDSDESADDSDDAEDDDGEQDEEESGSSPDDSSEEVREEGDNGGSSDESDEDTSDDEPGSGEAEESPEASDVEESGEEQSDPSAAGSDEAGEDEDTQSDGDSEGDLGGADEEGEPEPGSTDADDDGESSESTEPGDSDGLGGGDDEPGNSFRVEPDEEAEDEDIDLGDIGLHQHNDDPSAQEEKALEVAIVQEEYFEKPSSTINGVKEWFYESREDDADQRPYHAWEGRMRYVRDEELSLPPESVMGSALMRMRLVFAENKRTQRNRNQRSGRLETRTLGKRAPFGDDRLFGKKVVPAKRDYLVCLYIDVSGSTAMGGAGVPNIQLIKEAAMAQAELLARTGVPFEILAHTGAPATEAEMTSFTAVNKNLWLDIYHIKDVDQPWDDKAKRRLADIGPSYYNLDGHTLEYARRRIEKSRATDKVILYYSDGKMPLENYHEELEILQREIMTCKQKSITLLGVGIRTDSPAQHGLDTVQVDDSSDVGRVVQHLERRLVV